MSIFGFAKRNQYNPKILIIAQTISMIKQGSLERKRMRVLFLF